MGDLRLIDWLIIGWDITVILLIVIMALAGLFWLITGDILRRPAR